MLKHSNNISEFTDFAIKAADKAGQILLSYENKALITKSKEDDLDIATEADEASEALIEKRIKLKYPDHGWLGEENGSFNPKAPYQWIIDPLDGSKEFIRGIPLYCVNVSLEYFQKIIAAAVYLPAIQDLFYASTLKGSYLNQAKLSVSTENNLDKSIVTIHPPRSSAKPNIFKQMWNLCEEVTLKTYRTRMTAHDVVNLCWLAQGAIEGLIIPYPYPKWWDVSAGILIVEEAGGIVTDLFGNPIINRDLSKGLVASNGKIHHDLLAIINNN